MFLHDAKQVLPVDDAVIASAQKWLLSQQNPDGHWPARYYWSSVENEQTSATLTAYVARVLALTAPATTSDADQKKLAEQSRRELSLALSWLAPRTERQDEPYLIASYALALLNSPDPGEASSARRPLERLRSIAHSEGDTAYWELESNTPFYGWGRAGRLETTALVVEALERAADRNSYAPKGEGDGDGPLISHATLYLLKNQDRYGIWFSTQATVNVLRALAAEVVPSLPTDEPVVSRTNVIVDGKQVAGVDMPAGNQLATPVTVDLGKFLAPGEHHVELTRAEGSPDASVQLATKYYVPWSLTPEAEKTEATLHQKNSAESLRLSVAYDKQTAKIGEKITCSVKAERLDYRGYGMMLAEIGLPPGAEVDRDSLSKAMDNSGWEINQFDVLPDRVVVYLWPRAGGIAFSFAFATRFGINAETTPSTLYDYYNPDARAVVMPIRIVAQ